MNVKSGIFSSVVLPVGMALGTFIVPWASDKFGKNGRLPAVVICAIVSAVSVFIFPSLKTLGTASIGLFIAGFFVYAINGVVWAYSTDVGGRVFAGTAAGVLDWAAYMGAALQAIIFGRVLDKTGNWNIVFTSIAVICVLMMVLALIANIKPKNKIKKA
jgi:sugar phosphate permease